MYVDLLDVGVEGRLEVDLGLVTWSTDLDFARCTPAKCGEAGKSVSERAGITRSSARALTGEHGSVAHSSKPVRRPPLRRQVCQVLKSVTAGLGTEIVFWDSELLVCVLCDGNKCIYRKSRWLGPRGREVISKSILCFRSTHLTSTPLTASKEGRIHPSERAGVNPRSIAIRQKRYLRWKARRDLRPPSCTWFERLLILNRYTQKYGSVERATCTW